MRRIYSSTIIGLVAILSLLLPSQASADINHQQTTYQEATVTHIEKATNIAEGLMGMTSHNITLKDVDGGEIQLNDSPLPKSFEEQLKVGDTVILATTRDQSGQSFTYISDFKRSSQLLILTGFFLVVILFIGRWQGISSFIGMLISFLVIMKLVVPQILAGTHPIVAAMLGGLIIIPVTFYLSHGINTKTTVGIVGTLLSLTLTGMLSVFFVSLTRLTGFAAEEASFLQLYTQGTVNMRDLLLGGIIIGSMGILDDITISQTAIVERLRVANKAYTRWQLYNESMVVGRDHIASLVNTLVLVYAGASLPLFALFVNQNVSLAPVLNHEVIATEVVRTIVSSIGIVLAVPITSALASWQYRE